MLSLLFFTHRNCLTVSHPPGVSDLSENHLNHIINKICVTIFVAWLLLHTHTQTHTVGCSPQKPMGWFGEGLRTNTANKCMWGRSLKRLHIDSLVLILQAEYYKVLPQSTTRVLLHNPTTEYYFRVLPEYYQNPTQVSRPRCPVMEAVAPPSVSLVSVLSLVACSFQVLAAVLLTAGTVGGSPQRTGGSCCGSSMTSSST